MFRISIVKITGKAVMLDEIINYVQSLQQQVEVCLLEQWQMLLVLFFLFICFILLVAKCNQTPCKINIHQEMLFSHKIDICDVSRNVSLTLDQKLLDINHKLWDNFLIKKYYNTFLMWCMQDKKMVGKYVNDASK